MAKPLLDAVITHLGHLPQESSTLKVPSNWRSIRFLSCINRGWSLGCLGCLREVLNLQTKHMYLLYKNVFIHITVLFVLTVDVFNLFCHVH